MSARVHPDEIGNTRAPEIVAWGRDGRTNVFEPQVTQKPSRGAQEELLAFRAGVIPYI